MEADDVSELQPPPGLLCILQVTYEFGEAVVVSGLVAIVLRGFKLGRGDEFSWAIKGLCTS
jgi:hypothetical protein